MTDVGEYVVVGREGSTVQREFGRRTRPLAERTPPSGVPSPRTQNETMLYRGARVGIVSGIISNSRDASARTTFDPGLDGSLQARLMVRAYVTKNLPPGILKEGGRRGVDGTWTVRGRE